MGALEMSKQTSKAGRLIVRNLAFGAKDHNVRQVFEKIGTLTEVHLPLKDPSAGISHHRGFAFVQFADVSLAEKAIQELNGTKICGRGVAVDFVVDAGLYRSLQREDERAQKEQLDAPEPKAAKKEKKVEEATPKKKKDKKAAAIAAFLADEEDDDLDPEAKSNKEEQRRMKKLMNEDEDSEEDD